MAQVFFPRLAGMILTARSGWRMKVGWRSESNSASAHTQPMGVWAWACATHPGRLAQSFQGAWRADCAKMSCRCRSTTVSHFNPMPPRQRFLGVGVQAAHKKRAPRSLGKSCCIHCHLDAAAWTGEDHATYHFVQRLCDSGFVQPSQETVQSRIVGNRAQPQGAAQFRVLGQTYCGFSIGPVLVAHEAQDGQQLRLRELVFAKDCAIAPDRGLSHVQSNLPNRTNPTSA